MVVAVDGSRGARTALAVTLAFPWPAGTRVTSVTAWRNAATEGWPPDALAAVERGSRRVADRARRRPPPPPAPAPAPPRPPAPPPPPPPPPPFSRRS